VTMQILTLTNYKFSVCDFHPVSKRKYIMKIGDVIVVKPNRLDDYKILSSLGLIDEVGIVTKIKENNMCEIFVQNTTLTIPRQYLLEVDEKMQDDVCESCECTPCDCDWGHNEKGLC